MATNTSLLLICSATQSHWEQVQEFLLKDPRFHDFASSMLHSDLHVLNDDRDTDNFAAVQIADVRSLIQEMALKPYQAEQSVYVILKIDASSVPAQNALLKSLEEPPAHAQIILTTDQPNRVLSTILSRCIKINLQENNDVLPSKTNIQEIIDRVSTGTLSDIFDISEVHKERADALMLVQDLLLFLHQDNQQRPTLQRTRQLQKILAAKELLQKNVNVRLVIEDLFFTFR